MKTLLMILKIILNITFFCFYSLIWVITWSFLYGLILTIFWKTVPGPYDPIHERIAVLSVLLILILTLLLRKYFYLRINFRCKYIENKKVLIKEETKEDNKEEEIKNDDNQEEDLEIYVNKEIKK